MESSLLLNCLRMHCATLLLACSFITCTAQIQLQPANIDLKVSQTVNAGTCISRESLCSQLQNDVKEIVNSSIIPQFYGLERCFPADSCADIYQGHPSGYYWLNGGDDPQLVYCSLNENHCCNNSDQKWMRIAFLNMSDPSANCPDSLREVESPIRTCWRQFESTTSSVSYSSYGIPYSRVCGRIIAYQFGAPEAFFPYISQNQRSLEDVYADGVSSHMVTQEITFGHLLQQELL